MKVPIFVSLALIFQMSFWKILNKGANYFRKGTTMPTCWIIAGPNGAGKTTFALKYLPKVAKCTQFINADLIAAGISPLAPEREMVMASRFFLNEIKSAISKKIDFAYETTLAGRSYLRLIKRLKTEGWRVELIYLALPAVEISKMRVEERVRHGGHNIPVRDIERRFPRSLANLLNEFSYAVDECQCYLNQNESPDIVFEQQGNSRLVINQAYYDLLINEVKYER